MMNEKIGIAISMQKIVNTPFRKYPHPAVWKINDEKWLNNILTAACAWSSTMRMLIVWLQNYL